MNRILLPLLWLIFSNTFYAQTSLSLSTIHPDSLFVCGTDTLWFSVKNTSATTLTGVQANLGLPNGVEYLAGTVSGAAQGNISNLSNPQFLLGNLVAGATVQVQVLVSAKCNLVQAINNGQLFFHTITARSGSITEQLTSSQYNIETGLLILSSVIPQNLSGSLPQTVKRTITVRNTRLGRIGNLRITDEQSAAGISVSINGLTDNNPLDTIYDANAGAAFILASGNNDQWLDVGEELKFVEDITITGCRAAAYEVKSLIRVYWGCDTVSCAYDSALAFVQVVPAITNPELKFIGELTPFNDQCGDQFTWQYLTITNTGVGDALNTRITLLGKDSLIAFDAYRTQRFQNGTWFNAPAAIATIDSTLQCTENILLHRYGIFNLDTIAPGDTVRLRFAMYACSRDSCTNVIDSLLFYYYYVRSCPIGSLVNGEKWWSYDPSNYVFDVEAVHDLKDCIKPGETVSLEIETKSKLLGSYPGYYKLQIELPTGLSLDTTGTCAPHITNNLQKPDFIRIMPSANGTSRAEFAWKSVLPYDSIRIKYCLRYDCTDDMTCWDRNFSATSNGTFYVFQDSAQQPVTCDKNCALLVVPKGGFTQDPTLDIRCAFGGCSPYFLMVQDTCTSFAEPPPTCSCWPVFMRGTYNVYRTNYDCQDLDDNQIADSNDPPTSPDVRIRRFIPGDTLRLDIRGTVFQPGASIGAMMFKVFHENLTSDFLVEEGDSFRVDLSGRRFCSRDHFVFVGGELIIKRSNGSMTSCPLGFQSISDKHLVEVRQANVEPSSILEYVSTMDHLFLADFAKCDGPLSFGDSCILLLDWQIKLNILPSISDTTFDLRLMNFRVIPDHPSKLYTYVKPNPPFLCQYSGFLASGKPQSVSIRPCENSLQVSPLTYGIALARPNMFRNEVRPLTSWLKYKYLVPQDGNLLSVRLRRLQLQTGKILATDVPIPFTLSGNEVDLDLTVLSSKKLDEGYSFDIDFAYGPNCEQDTTESFYSESLVWHKDCFADSPYIDLGLVSPYGYFAAVPKLLLTHIDTLITLNGAVANINFTLSNTRPQVAFNPWLSMQTVSGTFTDLKLYNNGVLVPQTGAVYQLPNILQNGSLNLSASLTKTSCEPLVIKILYGWNCEPISSLNTNLCNVDTFILRINSLNPELEMDLINQPVVVKMCDTTGWFEVEIYNANLGNAYHLEYSVRLPQGLTYEPGTAQIAWPSGSAFTPFPDPQTLPNNSYYWNISNLLPALVNGLPAVNLSPQNRITIRFRARTQCGFVANTQPVFYASARKACGPIANTLRKPGHTVQLQGIQQPYQSQISVTKLSPTGAVGCGQEVKLSIQSVLGSVPGAQDSIYLSIPNGFSYVPGSYTPVLNAPPGPPNTTNGGWRLPLPSNLNAGATVRFEIKLRYDDPAGCIDQTLSVQTRQGSTAFCPAINAHCAVFVATGEVLYNIPVSTNQLTLTNFSASLSAPSISVRLSGLITNPTSTASGPVIVHTTLDLNGNGVVDLGEPQAGPPLTINSIAAFTTDSLFLSLDSSFTFSKLCQLLVWIDPQESCLCAPILERFEQIEVKTVPFVSCDIIGFSMGNPTPDPTHTYSWSPGAGLSCTNCSYTTFTPGPNVKPGDAFTYVLTETAGSCRIIYAYEIRYVNKPSISASDIIICRGDTVTLKATPQDLLSGISWTGPGISNPTAPQQIVSPPQTSTYTLTATVAGSCTGTESVTVTVLKTDTTIVNPVTICAGQSYDFLGSTLTSSGLYCVPRTNIQGCDSLICLQLRVLPTATSQTLILCEGGTVQVFDSLISAPGQYCRKFTNQLGCDSTHCITVNLANSPNLTLPDTLYVEKGDSVQLQGPDGYAGYAWSPSDNLSCTDCQNPFATPTDSLTAYVLTVTDANGCTASVTYRVVLVPPCNAQRLLIPNAFTPNGDSGNDVFRVPPFEGVEQVLSMKIFNRWGDLIFESNTQNPSWDGRINGKESPVDTYIYRISIGCPADGSGERFGEISLLR